MYHFKVTFEVNFLKSCKTISIFKNNKIKTKLGSIKQGKQIIV